MKRLIVLTVLFSAASALLGADLSGTWSAAVVLDAGNGVATFTFKQTGDTLSGTYAGTLGEAKVTGTVKGDQAEWSFENGQVGKIAYKGTLDGAGKMKGSVTYGLLGAGTFTAEKKT